MIHDKCSCNSPNPNCSRYGWMMEFKYDICQGKNILSEHRNKVLDIWSGAATPPLLTQAANLGTALINHALNGFKELSREDIDARLKICQSCDQITKDGQCNKCGCYVNEKSKWASEDCPLKKWALPTIQNTSNIGCNCS